MHALFQPKAQTGRPKPVTRRIGKIYVREILLLPQPFDHKKKGNEIMKWKSHSIPTCRFFQACPTVSKARTLSAAP